MRSETVIIDLTDRLDTGRCQQWLRQVRGTTADRVVHRLIDDVSADLRMLADVAGELTDEFAETVVGALASVAAAADIAAVRA